MKAGFIVALLIAAILVVACNKAYTQPTAPAPSAVTGSLSQDIGSLDTAASSADQDVALSDLDTLDAEAATIQ